MAFHPLPTDFIVITMLKVILKTESIETNYAGGWKAFVERYEMDEIYKPAIVPLTAMSYDDLSGTVDELVANGLTSGSDYAVADARQGVLEPCEGISIQHEQLSRLDREQPEWVARQM